MIILRELHDGGVGKVVCNLSSELAKRWNVSIVYYRDTKELYPFSDQCHYYRLSEIDIEEHSLFYRLFFLLRKVSAVRRLKKELDVDIALSLLPGSCFLNVLSKGKEKVICSERSNPKRGQGKFWLVKWLYQKSDWTIFQSEKVRRMFSKKIQEKSSVLKNPVLLPDIADEVRTHRIISLGRLEEQKNYPLLIHAFSEFHKLHPDYMLSIYGEGMLKGQLEQLISTLKLSDSVRLKGNSPDVHEAIKDAEMFVLSSDYEGLSNALLEAMAMGIASISTRCEGSTDVIRDGENGLLVDIGDEKGLANAMSLLAENGALRKQIEKQAMEDIKAFDKKLVAKEWEQVFLSIEGASKG